MTFTPMHLLGVNYQPRRATEPMDNYNSWCLLSSMGSSITILSMVTLTVIDPPPLLAPTSLLAPVPLGLPSS